MEDLLRYARAGKQRERLESVDVGELVRDTISVLNPPRGFNFDVVGQLPVLTTLKTPLQQIFQNLINNAVKHHDRPTGCVRISSRSLGEHVEFTVADDGPGIPPEFAAKIFRMFETLRPRDETEGSGMGLALIDKLVERYGGRVILEARSGRGATFRFTWPRRVSSSGSLGESA